MTRTQRHDYAATLAREYARTHASDPRLDQIRRDIDYFVGRWSTASGRYAWTLPADIRRIMAGQ